MFNHRISAFILVVVACTGAAKAGPWDGATYDTPNVVGNCVVCTSLYPSGAAIDLTNAYIPVSAVIQLNNPAPNTTYITTPVGMVSLNQFAPASLVSVLQSTVTSHGQSILNLQTQNAAFATQMASVTQSLSAISNEISGLMNQQRQTEKHAWIGSALASALVVMPPAEGKANRLGMATATVQGQSAIGLNYSHVAGAWDFGAGAAVSTSHSKYVEGRVSFGFSW